MGGTWWMVIFVYTWLCNNDDDDDGGDADAATRCLCSGEEGLACLSQERLCYLSLFLHFLLFIFVKFSVWKAFLRHLRKYRISNIYSPNKQRFWVATLDRNDTRLRNIIGFPLPIGLWSLEDKNQSTFRIQNFTFFIYWLPFSGSLDPAVPRWALAFYICLVLYTSDSWSGSR